MKSERTFEQAVQLAAAFVANGDIRLGDDLQRSQGLHRLQELIPELCRVLEAARQTVAAADH